MYSNMGSVSYDGVFDYVLDVFKSNSFLLVKFVIGDVDRCVFYLSFEMLVLNIQIEIGCNVFLVWYMEIIVFCRGGFGLLKYVINVVRVKFGVMILELL